MKKHISLLTYITALFIVPSMLFAARENGPNYKKRTQYTSQKSSAPDAYVFWINNIIMPFNADGVVADVRVGDIEGGSFQSTDKQFLFSGGFMLSGISHDSVLWSNAVASASRVTDYVKGRVQDPGSDKPGIYVVDRLDPAFGESWQTWKDAVAMGADFYDGDGDGIYSPIDKNGNGLWDSNEDAPDLLGDKTAWTVYNDAVESAQRRWTNVSPQGIDIQQTMFGFRSAGSIGNMLFLRYRIINRGIVDDEMDSVFFAVWADPDLGGSQGYTDDLVGCDTTRNAGFTWNDGPDPTFGVEAPVFMISFFQGPVAYVPGESFTDVNSNGVYDVGTDIPLDTAYNVRGQLLGIDTIPGAKNLGLSSFVNYVQSDPTRGDPNTHIEARNYMVGQLRTGDLLGPCTDSYGSAHGGIPCTSIDSVYWYSGDPVTDYGWIYTTPGDVRQMQNIGPFKLKKDEPIDIVVAYVVGRGSDAKNSVAVGRTIVDLSRKVYDGNFEGAPTPPIVQPKVRTTENTIELLWDTKDQLAFNAQSSVFDYDLRFEAFEVTMYHTNSTARVEGGRENAKVVARFDLANNYQDILVESPSTGERTILIAKGTQIDSGTYATAERGRIRVLIDTDPFTSAQLVKGKPYFISVIGYAVNRNALKQVNPNQTVGAYYLDGGATVQYSANAYSILNSSVNGIRPGVDFNQPYVVGDNAVSLSGGAEGTVTYDEVDKSLITGDEYEVSFFKNNASTKYSMYWRIKNASTNTLLVDSLKDDVRSGNTDAFPMVDGIMIRAVGVDASIKASSYAPSANKWYSNFTNKITGVYYTGRDTGVPGLPEIFPGGYNSTAKFEHLRNIEIRFGVSQKAYRYVKYKTGPTYGKFQYAMAMPVDRDTLANGRKGYLDVPFQVWVKDARYGEERQLACGFLETEQSFRKPNGMWEPDSFSIAGDSGSNEYIVVFNAPYTADTSIEFTGGSFHGVTRWANFQDGWQIPTAWDTTHIGLTPDMLKRANDKYFGGLYIIGLQQKRDTSGNLLSYQSGDKITIPITYPFTPNDTFRIQTKKSGVHLTSSDRRKMFEKVNVYPNPLFAYNPLGSYLGGRTDDPFVTFSNLPEDVTIKIYTLSGTLIRTLTSTDKALGMSSPYLEWDLHNDYGLRVASGMYIAIVSSPNIGEKVLKFAIIMPQKQIQKY